MLDLSDRLQALETTVAQEFKALHPLRVRHKAHRSLCLPASVMLTHCRCTCMCRRWMCAQS